MYNSLGPHWAGTLVACLAVIFVPVPFLLHRFGSKIRRMTKPGRDADDLGHMMVKMMAAQRAQAAAAAGGAAPGATGAGGPGGAGSAAPAAAAPLAATVSVDEKKDVQVEDEESAIEGAPQLVKEGEVPAARG